AHVHVRCPSARCRHEVIAGFPISDAEPPKLLTQSAARLLGRRIVFGRNQGCLCVAMVAICGSLGFGAFLVLWPHHAPSTRMGNGWVAYVPLAAVGVVGALMVASLFLVGVVLGAERWLAKLPRVDDVLFVRTPERYRE